MAKRYGRRRRRAHRERIAQLEALNVGLGKELLVWQKDTRRAEGQLERFRKLMADWDEDVRRMFGPFSALLFETANLPVRYDDPTEIMRLPVPQRLSPVMSMEAAPEEMAVARVAYLLHCAFKAYDEPDAYNRLVTYMRLTVTNHKASSYAFSEAYWRQFSRPGLIANRDITRIAEKIAEVMLARITRPEVKKPEPSTGRS